VDSRLIQVSEDLKSLSSQRFGKEILTSNREIREVFMDLGYTPLYAKWLLVRFRRIHRGEYIFRSVVVEWAKKRRKPRYKLTHRNLEALELRKQGLTLPQIAERLKVNKFSASKLIKRAKRALGKEALEPTIVAERGDHQNGNNPVQT
jgi:hypothetical protein